MKSKKIKLLKIADPIEVEDNKRILFTAMGLDIILTLTILLINRHLPPQIPLFYGLAEGEKQLVSWPYLTLPALLSLFILLLNSVLGKVIKDDFLTKVLTAAGVIGTFLAAYTIIKILFLVGSF